MLYLQSFEAIGCAVGVAAGCTHSRPTNSGVHIFSFLQTNCADSQVKSLHRIASAQSNTSAWKTRVVFLCDKKQTGTNFRQRQKPSASQRAVKEDEPRCSAHLPLSDSRLCSTLPHRTPNSSPPTVRCVLTMTAYPFFLKKEIHCVFGCICIRD